MSFWAANITFRMKVQTIWIDMKTGEIGSTSTCWIENNTSSNIKGWKLDFDADFTIYENWSSSIVHSGKHYQLTNLSWNSIIYAGKSITIGYNAHGAISLSSVKNVKLNGSSIKFIMEVPNPSVKITAKPLIINYDQTADLSWDFKHVNKYSINNEIGMPLSYGMVVKPQKTTTYTITGYGVTQTVTASVTVTVRPRVTALLTAENTVITDGESTILHWSTENASTLTVSDGTTDIPVSGNSLIVTPHQTTTYTLKAEGEGGIALASVTITVENINLNDHLLAYWPLEEVNDIFIHDISGNGFNGLFVVYPQWTSGFVSNYALNFTADTGYIIVENPGGFDTEVFTVSAWLTKNNPADNTDEVAGYFRYVNRWQLITLNNTLQMGYIDPEGQEKTVDSGHKIGDAGWHFYAVVVNNIEKTVIFYVDGEKVTESLSYDGFKTNYELPWNILIGQYDNLHRWNGVMDEIRFYSRALNGSEVKALFQQ